ncbi:hypothetical protein ACFY64_32010 [Streptomyces collinus]|uniref:hypothetical protein n=1 Tax=Streptomyces collinus TaxID=42684 RepID=UPI0036B8EB8B
MPRVDVEGSLLCDVLADGTVAGQALVEAVYDSSSGDRVGTRTVDPATGAAYVPQGILQPCPPPDSCTCETLLLCDTTPTEVVTFLRHLCRTCTGSATVTDTELDGTTAYVVQGEVGQCPVDETCAQFVGTLCYQQPATADPSFTLHKFNPANPAYPGCLVGLDAMDGDFPFIQYNDPITAWEGTYTSNTGTASNVEVSAPELGGFIDWSAFSPAIPSVPNAGIPAPYTGTAVINGITVTLEVFTASAITTGTQYLRMGGTEHFRLSFSEPVTMKFGTQGFADPALDNDERFCDVTATGVVTGTGEIRTAYGLHDCKTDETTWRDQVTGDEVDLTQAVVVPCPQAERDCASPTEPTATVGLCLADGTPIAVTVVRDCAGTVTSEGWLDLTTGAYSAGAPPVGTVACGDSRSIQVSGTFCDIDAAGEVVGLVLIEYTYDDTGAISSVRLVDAVTGGTYTPTGTVTTCPAGVEQPEQDPVVLCDTATDGTVTEFLRDFRRDENGAITGHSDYLLDGTAYTATGTVGVCSPPCLTCETLQLCDVTPGPDGWAMVEGQAASETLSNGITVTWTRTLAAGGVFPDTNMRSWIPTAAGATSSLSTSKPAQVRIGVSLAAGQQLTLPPGSEIEALSSHHSYDPATRVLTADGTSAMAGDDTATADAASYITHVYLARVADPAQFTAAVGGSGIGFDNIEAAPADPYPFLRTVCRGCDGAIVSTTDTELDGTTAYMVVGEAGSCESGSCLHCETVTLCDSAATCAPATVTDADWSPRYLTAGDTAAPGVIALRKDVPGGGAGFWGGGSTVFPNVAADPDGGNDGVHYGIAGVVTADDFCPDCIGPDDQVTITASGSATNNGPGGGVFTDGRWRILRDGGEANGAVPQLAQVSDSGRQPNSTWNFTASATVPWSDVLAGRIVLTLDLETRSSGSYKQWTADDFELCITPVTAAGGCGNTFRRTICRDCSGAIVSTTDYEPDGVTPYTPVGAVGECTPCNPPEVDACQHCETMVLCDDGADDTALIGGTTSSGTLSNGVTWQARGSAALQNPLKTNANGAWWNLGTFPNAVITPFTWSFNRPVEVEFSVVLWWSNATPTAASVQIPPNAEPVSLPSGYHYDPATRILSADNTLVDCSTLTAPSPERSARFRMRDAVTSFTLQSLGIRIAACGQFGNWWFGAIEVTPTGQFLRTICRDCDGTVTSTTDTGLDGVTPYTVLGAPKVCTPPEPADCCQPVQVCIADTVTETVEFISNEAQVYDNTVDTVWTWTPNGDANGPAAGATWYPTYRARFAPNPAAWSVVDTAASRPAGWIAPHPQGLTGSSGAPGEGPTLNGPQPWWARASFSLPAAADPDSIRVQITVLNADQQAVRFRLNNGAWQAMPASASHNGTPYTYGPGVLAGAQPGTNTLYFEVNETLPNAPTNGAGVMAHFIVTYDVPGLGQRSWTRMVCCDGSVYYLDEDGVRQDTLPPSSSLVACGGGPDLLVLCDDDGTFLRHISYVGDQIVTTDTDVNGSAYTPVGTVRSCTSSTAATADQPVSTGIARYTNDGSLVDLKGTYPGLQSVTLTVLSGTVATGMTNTSGGSGIAIPAGVTMTWSVEDTDDSSLDRALFQQQGAADYLLNWTWKATSAG